MSRLIARILLAIFLIPLSALVYFVVVVALHEMRGSFLSHEIFPWMGAGMATWAFMFVYWLALWWSATSWNAARIIGTAGLALGVGMMGVALGAAMGLLVRDGEIAYFLGSTASPLLWLVGTVFLWRETASERMERLKRAKADALVCPVCGYNLTGLSEARCPECGTRFTLNELLASQPGREAGEIEA